MIRATIAAAAVLVGTVCQCAPLPDPGRPCGEPVTYHDGRWRDNDARPIADTLTEDSIPYRWHCTPSADLVEWFAMLDE